MSRVYCMGRLSDFVNSGSRSTGDATVELSGFIENAERLGRIMTENPDTAKNIRRIIRKELQRARRQLSHNASEIMDSDPRKAARAVKHAVYKSVFGGNLSILQKRTSGAQDQTIRQRKVEQNPHQRGGNRRPYVPQNSRLDKYYGADRGFILRFLSSGTQPRLSRYGNRGMIRQSDWFGHTAPWQMDRAAEFIADEINKIIKEEANG